MAILFGQVEKALASVNGIAEEHRSKLRARLQTWQKLKFPAGVNTGRGVKALYGLNEIFQLVIMMELLKRGLTPERAIAVTNRHWESLKAGIHTCIVRLDAGARPNEAVAIIYVDGLLDLRGRDDAFETTLTVLHDADISAIYADAWDDLSEGWRDVMTDRGFSASSGLRYFRTVMEQGVHMNLSRLTERTIWAVLNQGIDLTGFREELRAWSHLAAAMHEHMATVAKATPSAQKGGWPAKVERETEWEIENRPRIRESIATIGDVLSAPWEG
jgi:hypothetical protein